MRRASCAVLAPAWARRRQSPAKLGPVVELLDHHLAVGRCVEAELTEHALVEVLAHRLHAAVGGGEDVHRADLLELSREVGVAGDRVVDLDVDEDSNELLFASRSSLGHQTLAPSLSLTRSGISSIRSPTGMPASWRRAIFSVAVSSLPSTMVPAWPKLIPCISASPMNRPAMKATIGR